MLQWQVNGAEVCVSAFYRAFTPVYLDMKLISNRSKGRGLRMAAVGVLSAAAVGIGPIATVAPASAAAPATPGGLTVNASLTSKFATWQWKTVAGAYTYKLTVKAIGSNRVKTWETQPLSMPTISIAKTALPTGATGGYKVTVQARTLGGTLSAPSDVPKVPARVMKSHIKEKVTFKKNDPSSLKKAAGVVAKCTHAGLATGGGTFAAGSPFALTSTPIPGVGEVTWGGLGALAGFAGGSATMICFTDKVIPFG